MVEADGEPGVIALVLGRRAGDQLLRRDAVLACPDHDGRAVAILGAHENAVLAHQALEPHPDVGLHRLGHVAQMQ